MTEVLSPEKWAIDISVILKTVFEADRFPVDVREVSREFSRHRFPDDPITMIRGDVLPGFEGALVSAPSGKKGWGIIYNNSIHSTGRINFTLAHEFGHYLLHRIAFPKGFQCSNEDMARWESEYGQIEHQANVFASTLLMPLDDYRTQITSQDFPDLNALGQCADRYEVSLIAAILRWLQFTARRSVLVISKDGFILWARSSEPALKSRLFFKTRDRAPIEIPKPSLAAHPTAIVGTTSEAEHDHNVWLNTPCKEFVLFSNQYDFTISLLHFTGDTVLSP